MTVLVTSACAPAESRDRVYGICGAHPVVQVKVSRHDGLKKGLINRQVCGEVSEGTLCSVYHSALMHYPPP